MKMAYWVASKDSESKKIAAKESDWMLPGLGGNAPESRTRNGGIRTPPAESRYCSRILTYDGAGEQVRLSSSSESWYAGDASSSSEEDDEKFAKPDSQRAFVEVDPMLDFIERNASCQKCKSPVKVTHQTVCVATTWEMVCLNEACKHVDTMSPPSAANNIPCNQGDKRQRNTDYAINILFVLGFISCGDGGKEAARILGLLGLPNSTTMETRSFPEIEARIGGIIRELRSEILMENLTEEVRQSMAASADFTDADFQNWKLSHEDPTYTLPKDKYPRIHAGSDMGWQQKGSGHAFNSPSGHASYTGKYTRKALCVCVKSKICSGCDTLPRRGIEGPAPRHSCVKNHFGSSGAMESAAALEMIVDLYDNKRVILEKIVADDDSSTKAVLTWNNADYMRLNNEMKPPQVPITRGPRKGELQDRPEGVGRLPGYMEEPLWAADPNHRKKLLTGELAALCIQLVDKKITMTKMDALRIGKNYGYFIRSIPRANDLQASLKGGKAVLDHHFDVHDNCGLWCRRKLQTDEEREATKHLYYRDMKKDAKLYAHLKLMVDPYITEKALEDLNHGMDTNINESINNTISWFAPKNKVYCSTWSLTNRISLALGINSVGFTSFYIRLLTKMGIASTPDIMHFLQVKDRNRTKRLAKAKTIEQKKHRIRLEMEHLKENTIIAHRERARRDGTYKRGMSFERGTFGQVPTNKSKKLKKGNPDVVCRFCLKVGHSRRDSKECGQHIPRKKRAARQMNAEEEIDALDAEAMDSVPLDAAVPSDQEDFFDAGTWSEDEDGPGAMNAFV